MELKSKRDRVCFLLDHWCDYWETMGNDSFEYGIGGDDSTVALMPAMSRHPSVVELEKAIRRARTTAPADVAHTMAFYTAEWRTTTQTIKRRSKKGRVEHVKVRVRQRVLPKWIIGVRVVAGTLAIVDAFQGEVFIPSELLEAA